jgi:DNA-binding NarL/FixJ family response regulator
MEAVEGPGSRTGLRGASEAALTAAIVHGDRHVRSYLRMLLGRVEVTTVAEAKAFDEALGICQSHRPAIVLLDIDGLGLPVLEALQQLRTIDADVAVLSVSLKSDAEFSKTPSNPGVLAHIPIHVIREEIVQGIAAALDLRAVRFQTERRKTA